MKTPVVAAVLAALTMTASPTLAQNFGSTVGYFYGETGYDPRPHARHDGRTVVVDEYTSTRRIVRELPRARAAGGAYVGYVDGYGYDDIGRYVDRNPVRGVYLPGSVVAGHFLPSNVYLRAVPGYVDYSYAYVNGRGVVVENSTRRIAHVVHH